MVHITKSIVLMLICTLLFLAGCGSEEEPTPEASAPVVAATATQSPTEMPTATIEQTPESTPVTQEDDQSTTAESDEQTAESVPAEAADSSAASDDLVTLNIDMHDAYYGDSDTNISDPPVWTAKTGQTVIVNLVNHGSERHNWAIVKLENEISGSFSPETDSNLLLAEPGMVYAKSQTQWVLRAPEPGEYLVICTVNGHYPTMQGKFIVTAK